MIQLRKIRTTDYQAVAELICDSTNAWYQSKGLSPIFPGGPQTTMLFCDVYESLDQGDCILAEDQGSGRLVGSCFFHPRPLHVSLGIMNVHADYFGQGVARRLLKYVCDLADELALPVRLVSSAMNLDSFSLYSKAGFIPMESFQDMILNVPQKGIAGNLLNPLSKEVLLRDARLDDVEGMVKLEQKVAGINRAKDFRFFVENESGYWHVTVAEANGKICGVIASISEPGSSMLGPAVFTDPAVAVACVARELDFRRGKTMVFLAQTRCRELVDFGYSIGAKNCEIHFLQVRGNCPAINGIIMPTFMPETG